MDNQNISNEERHALHAEAKRIEEDSLHSAKGHFEAGRRWGQVHLGIGLPAAILAAISGVSAFQDQVVLAGILALLVAALTAITTFLDPSDRSNVHHQVGTRFNSLRNRARIFHKIELLGAPDFEALKTDLQILSDERDELNASSPQIPRWAFEAGRHGIEEGEASYQVDKSG